MSIDLTLQQKGSFCSRQRPPQKATTGENAENN